MNRRRFLATGATLSSAAALWPHRLFAQETSPDPAVEKVHVIFKTHLDVGYTDMAAKVVETYYNRFIPGVLSLTEQLRREQRQDRYIWTTGSWLIYRYLEEASPENRRRMEQAIEAGDFVWLGVPFTTDTELMDRSAFRLALEYSARLDRRFHRKTLAAKMTDVPGHTRGMVPVLAEMGIELFHVGVNSASAVPAVPPLFVWKSPEGAELMMMYQNGYGDVMVLPGGRVAVSISFTMDNIGPHSLQQVNAIYAGLRRRFPNAKVFASDLNALAVELRPLRPQLAVVTQEIGDTWINGPGSDPWLMARFRELSRLRNEWIAQGKLVANGDADVRFGIQFVRVAEHTWGMKIQSLKNFKDYDMADFRAVRSSPEFKRMEASWVEKRECLDQAIATLPTEMATQANQRLSALRATRAKPEESGAPAEAGATFDTRHFRVGFDGKTGAINLLQGRSGGRSWADAAHPLGLFSYQTFSQADYDRMLQQYVQEKMRKVEWPIQSWTKPGLDKSHAKSALAFAPLKTLRHHPRPDGDLFVATLAAPVDDNSGCPHELELETFFPAAEPTVKWTLKWFKKPACRLPEALWFSFQPPITPAGRFEMDKMGQPVSPLDVVVNGNRNMHAVISGVSYREEKVGFQLETLDAFLVAPGRRSLLIFDNQQPDMAGGLHCCLYNNLRGTNWTLWFEDDMQFRFALKFS